MCLQQEAVCLQLVLTADGLTKSAMHSCITGAAHAERLVIHNTCCILCGPKPLR